MLPDPSNLFLECLENPEPLIDEAYCYDDLIISQHAHSQPTEIMETHIEVRERICAAKIAKKEGKCEEYKDHIQALDKILINKEAAQFLELASFFPAMDFSFSAYKSRSSSARCKLLKIFLKRYLDRRHDIYMSHGYSVTTIQVRKDFSTHKRKGESAKRKIKNICEELGYMLVPQNTETAQVEQTYCFIDQRQGQVLLNSLEKEGESWYQQWSQNHGKKKADVLFSGNRDQYFICEAKHIKESGGGQDKQMNELIAFIDNENHTHQINGVFYVAFLDGVYFNKFIEADLPNKIRTQKEQIEKCLRGQSKRNFFVNTYGLKKLLKSMKTSDTGPV